MNKYIFFKIDIMVYKTVRFNLSILAHFISIPNDRPEKKKMRGAEINFLDFVAFCPTNQKHFSLLNFQNSCREGAKHLQNAYNFWPHCRYLAF